MNNKVTYEEALQKSIEYFNGDELAAEVFLGKYALTDPEGNILEPTPLELHHRLAKELARIELSYPNPMTEQQIFDLFDRFKYVVPQGSPMSGIGNKFYLQSLGNCFVLPSPLDSYGSILKTDQELVQLAKRRSGIGFDISNIRPRGMPTNNAAKTTDGISVFMERFSNSTREVAQAGRRGALLLSISVHHPEIENFINIKRDKKKVTGANITVALSEEFLNAVRENGDYELRWPVDSKEPKVKQKVSAKKIWDQIIASNWESAEPGIFIWPNVTKYSPADCYADKNPAFKTISSNPCGEILMGEDSCRLLLLNVSSYIKNPFQKNASFDLELFADHIIKAQRLMDDIVSLEIEHIDRILAKIESDPEPNDVKKIELDMWNRFKNNCIKGRRTGLGITALGDAIAALNMKYGSKNSIEFTEYVYKNLALNAYRSTVKMAAERGPFPEYEYEIEKDNLFINQIMDLDPDLRKDWERYGRRNIAITTTAPAGSVSILTQTTSGIEPVYLISYKRRKKINPNDKKARVDFVDDLGDRWQEYDIYHHGFKKWMEVNEKTEADIKKSPYWKATSNDVDWVASVEIQSVAQKWICHSLSKTINLPKNTTKKVIDELYRKAIDSRCKGITVYRDGSRSGVLVSTENKDDKKQRNNFIEHHAPKRPSELPCDIYHMTVRGEKWNIFVGLFDGKPYEIFAGRAEYVSIPRSRTKGIIKKNGHYDLHIDKDDNEIVIRDLSKVFENETESAFTRTLSLALRHGAPVQYVVEQLEKGADKESDMFSLSKGLMRCLKNYIVNGTKPSLKKCKHCGSEDLSYMEGCISCVSCGWSKCS